eukprot:tig00000097_g3995.t1
MTTLALGRRRVSASSRAHGHRACNAPVVHQVLGFPLSVHTWVYGIAAYLAAAVKLHGRTRFTNIMNYITTTKAEESRAYIWDPRLDGKIKLVGTDEYIRRNPGIARKPFVRPFVVWSTDFKDLRTNEPTGLARFGHIQGVVFKPSGSNRPPRRSPTGTETTGTSDGDDSSSDSGGSTAESVAPSETPSAGTPSLASRVQSSAFAPHGLLGPLTRQHTHTIAYNDLTNPRTSTDLTMGCWLLYSGRGPDYERITSARHRAFEDPEFAASYHLYDWSPLQRSHQLNAHAILETLHEIENFRWDFTTSQGLSADLAFTRALFTRAAFILNSIGLAAWDVVLHNDFRSHDAQRTRFYERHVLQRDTRLRHAWPQLVKYLRASLSRHREAIPFRSPGEPGYRPAERRDGAAGTEVDAINEIHYGWPSNRHLNKLANADCKPILGVGYFSATMRNNRPPLRLSAAPCRARPFAATDVLMNVHRRTTTRKRPRLKRTAPLPPASVISGSTPCTPYEQSYLASLRVCAARMLGFDDVEDPLDVPLFGDGGPSVPHPIARMTDTNRTLRERINDGRICVNLHIAAIDHRRQVLQYLLTKALVDTGAAADVLDGSIADKLPGLRYSNAPRVHLTGFGTDMTAYARIAFIAIKVGPVTIPRKVLVVAPGLMGNTPMLLGLTTLVALNAHIVLDPANWGMTITSPDSSDGERFHVPFRLRASTTAAFWSDWRRTSLYGRVNRSFDVTCHKRLRTRLSAHRKSSSLRHHSSSTTTASTEPTKSNSWRPVRLQAGTVIAETEFGTWPESEFRPHENVETYPKGCYSSWTPQQQLTFPISSVAAQIYENFKPVVVPRRSQPRRYISRARRLYPEVYHRRPPEPNYTEGEAAHVGSVNAAADIPLSHEASERLMSYVARVVTPYTARTGDHFNDKELMELASFFEPHFARFDSEPMLVGPAVGPTVPIASVNADARMEPPSSDTAPPTKPSPETIKAMVDALLKPSESNPDALPEDRTQLQNLLTQRQHCFAQNINPRELLKYKHSIRLLPGVPAKHLPLYTVPRRLSPPAEKAAKAEIEKLLRDGLIEPSQAGFGSPVVLAPKKDGTMRFCVDYRKLNSLTERDVFPLPRIEDQLERLQGASTFSTGDATSGFWQLELDEESRDLTTFIVPWGMYRWKVTPFGITNGPAAFCRAVTSILGNLLSTCVVAYVDDLTVHSPNVKQHLLDLEAFFAAIDRGNLKLKPSKCRFMVREVELLGFRVSSDGIRMDPKKVEIISKITANELQTVEQLRSFLGLTGFYRRFVQSYARRELPLRDLLTDALRADRLNLVWNDEALAALDDLKKAMCEDIVLMLPDFTKPFIIYTDWSKRAMGAVLMQEDKDGRERPIAFISRTLTNMERKYQSPTEGECIAVLWAVKVWHHYFVCGHPFTIRTDHSALQWLKTQELANNKTLGRAAIALNHYNYTIEYRNGRSNVVADCCSRLAETHAVYKPGGADGTDITTSIPDGAHGFGVPDAGDYDDPRELYRVAIHRTSSALQHTLDGPAWIPTGDRRRATTRPEHLAPAPPRRDRDDPQTSRRRPRSLTPDTQRVRDIVENGGLEDVESQITLERLHENGALSAPDVVPMEVDTPAPAAAADEAGATAPPARRRRGRYRPAGRR